MARIDKMRIQGIRSFGPNDENAQNITFYSPITCIVGQNGCGKTTIIECLRYATTGNTPPSTDKGRSFVYDPKLTNGGEVKGQVKLQFVNLKGEKMAVTRTLQVTQRLGKLEMKTVDPLLNMFDEKGEVKSVGGRCLDIKKLVLSNMGISEAILDNVIFCHQDDSLWPLDEGKKLKEKFDEIFDATKYNKASDTISKLHKTKQTELRVGNERLNGLEERHREARKKQSDLEKNMAEHADAVAKMEDLEREKEPKMQAYSKVCERERKFTELQSKISAKETEKDNLEEQQRELRSKIKLSKPHDGPKEDLERKIRDFQGELRTKKDEIAEHYSIQSLI
ncbi:hypothetical protein B566_EDAN011220 [Ephemera danica]|nr:hypothetical protein B566_EDAN011220 [Ephemera danica]